MAVQNYKAVPDFNYIEVILSDTQISRVMLGEEVFSKLGCTLADFNVGDKLLTVEGTMVVKENEPDADWAVYSMYGYDNSYVETPYGLFPTDLHATFERMTASGDYISFAILS